MEVFRHQKRWQSCFVNPPQIFELFFFVFSQLQVSWIQHDNLHIISAGRYTYTSDTRFQASQLKFLQSCTMEPNTFSSHINILKNIRVEKILKESPSIPSIPSPSPSVKIQIMLGDVNKLFVFKSLLTTANSGLPLQFKQTFLPII